MLLTSTVLFLAAQAATLADLQSAIRTGLSESRAFEACGQVSGVVEFGNFAMCDRTGHAFIHNASTNRVNPGDFVTVRGILRPEQGGFSRILANDVLTTGNGHRPEPRSATLERISFGEADYQVVRTRGWVSDISPDEIDSRYCLITLTDGHASVIVPYPRDTDPKTLKDAHVELTGVCRPTYSTPRLFSPHLVDPCVGTSLRILKAPPADWFAVDSIEFLTHVNPQELQSMGRRRMSGMVLAVWDRRHVLLHTKNSNADIAKAVLSNDTPLPNCGETIEVAGYPETDLFVIALTDARWRTLHAADARREKIPEVTKLSLSNLLLNDRGEDAVQARRNGSLVRTEGCVIKMPTTGDERNCLLIEDCGLAISVYLNSTSMIPEDVSVGCRIDVTGIALLETELWRSGRLRPRVLGFAVIPRTGDDIVVVSRPPWWTSEKLVFVIGLLVAALVCILGWIYLLNRVVERRTRALLKARLAHDKAELKKEERTKLAVELHDTLSQNLTGIAFQLDVAELTAESNPQDVLPHLRQIRFKMQSCRDNLKNCLWDLRNLAIDKTFLADALRETLAPIVGKTKISFDFPVRNSDLDGSLVHAVICIVRELAVNAVRHGKASRIDISGRRDADGIRLTVKDNGSGFDPKNRPGADEGHFGLQGVAERVARLNGEMTVTSRPGQGTKVFIRGLHEKG